jgi:hypothetical protein
MLEKMLSRGAYKIYIGLIVVLVALGLWGFFTNTGPIRWLNEWQAEQLWGGYYYAELTLLLLALPGALIAFGAGLLFDAVTGQGIFTNREEPAEEADPGERITYRETTRREVIAQVRGKYEQPLRELRALGFAEYSFHSETIEWLGLKMGLTGLLGAVGFLGNEVVRWGPRLTVSAFFPLMTSRRDSIYASLFGLGVTFWTRCTDGTAIISSNFRGMQISDAGEKVYKATVAQGLSAAYMEHRRRVQAFVQEGRVVDEQQSFSSFMEMSRRLDDYGLKHRREAQKSLDRGLNKSSEYVSMLVGLAVMFGVIAFEFLLINVLANLLPACWFLRNMRVIPVWQNLLIVLGLVGLAWIAGRVRRYDLYTVNGCGTALYGSEPAPDGRGSISTKWLVLPGVPVIPIRSYRIFSGDPEPAGTYRMESEDRLNWQQVGGTVAGSWWRYLLLALVMLAPVVWALTECL